MPYRKGKVRVRPDDEELVRIRAKLIANNRIAAVINSFVGSDQEALEFVFADSNTDAVDGVRFKDVPTITPQKMYSMIYTMARTGYWLKNEVWVKKRGNSTWLYKHDPNTEG